VLLFVGCLFCGLNTLGKKCDGVVKVVVFYLNIGVDVMRVGSLMIVNKCSKGVMQRKALIVSLDRKDLLCKRILG
jgi:hypothetical protein